MTTLKRLIGGSSAAGCIALALAVLLMPLSHHGWSALGPSALTAVLIFLLVAGVNFLLRPRGS